VAFSSPRRDGCSAKPIACWEIAYNEAAGRTAYLAGFHAAKALISDRTGRAPREDRWDA